MEKNHNYNFGMEHRSEEVVCKYIIQSLGGTFLSKICHSFTQRIFECLQYTRHCSKT